MLIEQNKVKCIIKDIHKLQQMEKRAAVALIYNEDRTKILGVTRKDNFSQWGLPGGKVDPGESFFQAVIREVKEETGLNVTEAKFIFERLDDGFIGRTFLCKCEGEIHTTEAGKVDWITFKELKEGPFGIYNANLEEFINNSKLPL